MKTRLARLIELNARTNNLLEFRRFTPDEEDQLRDAAARGQQYGEAARPYIGAAAGAGAVGYGLYRHGQKTTGLTKGFENMHGIEPIGEVNRVAGNIRAGASDLTGRARSAFSGGWKGAGRVGSYAKSAGGEVKGALSGLWKKLSKLKFESKEQRLIQLNEKLGQIIKL